MTEDNKNTFERHSDVAILGGSAAGLAAGLQLSRAGRFVIVVDAGEPRNQPALHMHSYLGHEGISPLEFAAITKAEVRSYGCEVLDGRATDATQVDDGRFRVELTGGHCVIARRVLVATGIVDELPDIDGLREQWGQGVIHCPFCHGYEARDQRIVQIVTHPIGLHPAALFRHLSEQLTLILHDGIDRASAEVHQLRTAGVAVEHQHAVRVMANDDGHVTGVQLHDGSIVAADVVAISPSFTPRTGAVRSLGIAQADHPSGLGKVIDVDASGETSVPCVYAAGNVTDPSQQVLQAAAHGSRVGAMISLSLAHDDLQSETWGDAKQSEWDSRYGGERVWSGNPNGSLVHEAAGLETGRALDVGAGEGGDAVWLAEQGWQVVAADISERAVEVIGEVAKMRDLSIECVQSDANAPGAFGERRFDLVTAHYASIPRTRDGRAVYNLLNAVAPGGTLLVVGHDAEPMRRPLDTRQHSRLFDPDAYVRVDEFRAAVSASTDWVVAVDELRPRPGGHSHASHLVDDVVFRARRTV